MSADDDPFDGIDMSVFTPAQREMLGDIERVFRQMAGERKVLRRQVHEAWNQADNLNAQLDRILALTTFSGICPDCGAHRDESHTEESCEARQADLSTWIGSLNELMGDLREIDRDEVRQSWQKMLRDLHREMQEMGK